MKTVYLIEAQPTFAKGLEVSMRDDERLEFMGHSATAAEGMSEVRRLAPDVVVVDISIPDFSGTTLRQAVEMSLKPLRAVALTDLAQKMYVHQAYAARMNGYVLKQTETGEILDAIVRVLKGEIYLDPVLISRLMPPEDQVGRVTMERLADTAIDVSARELDVLKRVALGHSCKEIANDLGLSPKSVETYKARALQKLGLETRVDLVRFASVCGWYEAAH